MRSLAHFPRVLAVLLAIALGGSLAAARMVSVNLANGATGNTAIDGLETFGVPALGTVTDSWNNLKASAALLRDDGSESLAGITVAAPAGFNFFGAGYVNTPLNYGMVTFGAESQPAVTVSNLNLEFPEGCIAIVYVSGFAGNTGAAISDGVTTFHYRPVSPAPASFLPADLVQTTVQAAPADGAAPVAQYAVFGSAENPLTANEITFTLQHLYGGGAGFGGVQLVSVNSGGGGNDPTWTDPALGTYFLDAVNGSDASNGRSPETAWKTLSRLNGVVFKPGDVVLFKAGSVFTGSFFVLDSGTPEAPIVFGAYGTGPKPRLQGGPSDVDVIYIEGNECLEFRDLEISNFYPAGTIANRYGIRIVAPAASGEIRNLHFHGLDFISIMGSGNDPETGHESRAIDAKSTTNDDVRPYTRWNSFVIEDCTFLNIDGRAVQVNDRCRSLSDFKIRGLEPYQTVGFVFQNNYGQNIYRNLLQLAGTKDALIQHNYMSGTTKGSAFWPFDAEGTVVQFNDFRHLRNPDADGYVCHFDYNCVDTLMQYNFGYDVDGGLIEIIVLSDFEFFQERAIARYNIGVDVGFRNKENSAGIMFSGRVTQSQVYNNTLVFTNRQGAYKGIAVNNWGDEWPFANYIHNNLFLATGNPVTHDDDFRLAESGNVLSHNLYYGNIPVPAADLAPVTGDPKLANPGGLDPAGFKLLDGSAAIAAGKIIAANGGRDFFENPVPADLVPSIGFHEYQTEGVGRWAGYWIEGDGFVDTGTGFLGWLWVGAAESGVADWVYCFASAQWMYLLENYITAGSGAWLFVHDAAGLGLSSAGSQWFASAALATWAFSPGANPGSGPGWLYVLDLAANP